MWPVGAVSMTTKPCSASATVAGEGAEDGDLFGAGRPQILLQQLAPALVQLGAGGRHHLGGVDGGLDGRIDARDAQAGDGVADRGARRGRPDRWW